MTAKSLLPNEAFQKEVLDASHQAPVVAVFTAAWCGPCRSLKPKITELANERNLSVVFVDVGTHSVPVREQNIRAVPTVIVFNRGLEMTRFSGDKSKDELLVAIARAGGFQQNLL